MDAGTAAHLIEINHNFYTRFGIPFSTTRHRLQPGVRRVIATLSGDESILDLGCGNGELARELAKGGHRGPYLGVDFSVPLLQEAEGGDAFARFIQMDLIRLSALSDQLSLSGGWSLIMAFAVLHHIPSNTMRLDLLRAVRGLVSWEGKFMLSNWQFLNSEKLKARIQDWSKVGLSREVVDPGDYLLDWRSGGTGLRYIHHFTEAELSALAEAAGFRILETFYSDGESGNLGLYQIWQIDPTR
jgi:tRNA (uracil-5-)-methyltransferase TRM9